MPSGAAPAATALAMPRWCAAVALLTLVPAVLSHGDGSDPPRRASSNVADDWETKYVAHMMPWFERVTFTGGSGNHWCDADFGNSYYESIFDRYSSADPAVIRKQLLLMKIAGLDGVWIDLQIPDWLPAVRAIVTEATSLGMNFAVVIDNYALPGIVETAKEDMLNFMDMPNYYRVFGRPVLPYFEHPKRWGSTLMPSWRARDGHRPYVIGSYVEHQEGQLPEGFDSLFFWHSPDLQWLETYYREPHLSTKVGSVFHGWREAYADRKHMPPYLGFLQSTLDLVQEHKPYFAQLVTWNDYTEGTMFEPAWLANASSPHACADPRKSLWQDEVKSCSQVFGQAVFTEGGVLPPCLPSSYEAAAASSEDAGAAVVTCSGSGKEPCADVTDCSKPVGEIFGPAPAGCPSGNRSAYAHLATVARAVAGMSVEAATAKFEAILAGWEPEPAPDAAMSAAIRSKLVPFYVCFALAISVFASALAILSD